MHLRPLRNDDRSSLLEILAATAEFSAAEVACATELIDEAIAGTGTAAPEYRCVVAERGGAVLGYVLFGRTPLTDATWDVYWIAAAPAARGNGVGRTLLARAEHEIAALGGRTVRIETSARDSYGSARGFYDRAGYRAVGFIADFYRPGDGLVTYAKFVSPLQDVVTLPRLRG